MLKTGQRSLLEARLQKDSDKKADGKEIGEKSMKSKGCPECKSKDVIHLTPLKRWCRNCGAFFSED